MKQDTSSVNRETLVMPVQISWIEIWLCYPVTEYYIKVILELLICKIIQMSTIASKFFTNLVWLLFCTSTLIQNFFSGEKNIHVYENCGICQNMLEHFPWSIVNLDQHVNIMQLLESYLNSSVLECLLKMKWDYKSWWFHGKLLSCSQANEIYLSN